MTTIKSTHSTTSRPGSEPEATSRADDVGPAPRGPSINSRDGLDLTKPEASVGQKDEPGLERGMVPPKPKPIREVPTFESVPELPQGLEAPNRLKGLIRGTEHEAVFSKSNHWLGKHAVRLGNNLTKAIHRALDKLVHDEKKVEFDLAEFGPADLDLAVRGQLLRERDLKSDDPRKKAIEAALRKDPNSIPVWLNLALDPKLSAELTPSLTLPSGVLLNLGINLEVGASISSERLLTPTHGDDWKSAAKKDAKRLSGHPLSASALSRVEQGASFSFAGNGTLKIEPSIGLGIDLPSGIDAFSPEASISAGLFTTLKGEFAMKVLKTEPNIAQLEVSSLRSAAGGLSIKAHAGLPTDVEKLQNLFESAAKHFQNGGTLDDLPSALSTEEEKTIAGSFPEYLSRVATLTATGISGQVLSASLNRYATLALDFTKERSVSKSWGTKFEFQFEKTGKVEISDARYLPTDLADAELPLEIEATKLAAFAYNAAIRGDLSFAQHFATLPGSGVRLAEDIQETKQASSQRLTITLPFISMAHSKSTSDTFRVRTTSELGKIESQLYAFNEAFTSFFGNSEETDVDVRVHAPNIKSKHANFIASDDSISADFVVRNDLEVATSFEEFQDQVGLLNALSAGALRDELEKAVTEGREDGSDQHWFRKLIHGDDTFGRSNVNFHVWLGEAGLRNLLRDNRSPEDLYRQIGQAFIDLSSVKEAKAPRWSRRPEILEHLASGKDLSHFEIPDEDIEEIEIAREVVSSLQELQGRLPEDATPAQETALAAELRDMAGGFSDRLKAFTALAVLVPDKSRAVEMHLSALRKDEAPIRFAYLQDSRGADLLQATAYASSALSQLNTYGFAVSHETRVRLGAVLNEIHGILNSPSPDPYRLRIAQHALNRELDSFDSQVSKILPDLVKDKAATHRWLDQLPEDNLIAEVLPTKEGKALVALKTRLRTELEKSPPSYPHLKDALLKLNDRRSELRAITQAAPILRSLASTIDALPIAKKVQTAEAAEELVSQWQKSFGKSFDSEISAEKLDKITELIGTGLLQTTPPITIGDEESAAGAADKAPDLAEDRKRAAEHTAGKNLGFSQSYFLKDGTIAKHFFSPNVVLNSETSISASQIDMATLEMLSAQRRANVEPPALSNSEAWSLLGHIAKGESSEFLKLSSQLAYREKPPLTEERFMLSHWLQSLTPEKRAETLNALPKALKSQVEQVISLPENRDLREARSQRSLSDQKYLEKLSNEDPSKLGEALSILGYTNTLKHWQKPPRYRLDDVLVGVSGDKLRSFLNGMNKADRKAFMAQIKASDLSPFTRARLAGDIVSRDVFWKLDEETVLALVSGMEKADYPIFFDALYADGKLEEFLAPGSFWQRLLNILTFGIARLFTHDNQAALRVLASHGFSSTNLGGHYDTTSSLSARYETLVAKSLTKAAVDPLPIDDWVKSGIVAAHSIMWETNLEDLKTLPKRAKKLLEKVAEVTAEKVASRVLDISTRGGDFEAVKTDLGNYFKALSPEAIKGAFADADTDAESVLIAKAIRDGVIKKLEEQDKDASSPYITPELVNFVSEITDHPSFHPEE